MKHPDVQNFINVCLGTETIESKHLRGNARWSYQVFRVCVNSHVMHVFC